MKAAGCLTLALALLLATLAGCSRGDRVPEHLAKAQQHLKDRQYERAKIEFVNVLRAQPTNGPAIQGLAKVLMAQGQPVAAFPLVLRARIMFPEDIELREHLVRIYASAQGETNRARFREELEQLLQMSPTNEVGIHALTLTARTPEELAQLEERLNGIRQARGDSALLQLADAERLRRVGDLAGTEAAIQKALALEPNSVSAHLTLGNLYLATNRRAEGEQALQKAAELSPPDGPARERWARYLLETRRLEEAASAAEAVTSAAPERVGGWSLRTSIALGQGQIEKAEEFVARALALAPADPEATRLNAQIQLARGKTAKAVEEMQKVAEIARGSAEVQYQLGIALLANRDTAKGQAAIEEAVALNPDFIDARLLLAELDLRRGETTRAIATLQDLLRRVPNLVQGHVQLLRALRAAGRAAEGVGAAQTALQLFPTNFPVALQAGLVQRAAGRNAEARQIFEAAQAFGTNTLAATEQLVVMDVEAGDFAAAHQRVDQRIRDLPDQHLVWLMKGEIHLAQARAEPARASAHYQDAEKALRKVLELVPDSREAMMSLTRIYLQSGDEKQALARLNELLEKAPNDFTATMMAAMLENSAKNYARARTLYEAALKLRPTAPVALNNYAYLLAEHFNDLEGARRAALQARERAPEDAIIADTLGWIEYRRGQYADALRLLKDAEADLQKEPEFLYHLGMAHYMMGHEEDAKAALARAVAGTADFPGKAAAAQSLAMLQGAEVTPDAATLRALELRAREAPSDVVALARLARAYELSGDVNKAQATYEAAMKVNTQAPSVLIGLASLNAGPLKNPSRALELARSARANAPGNPEIAFQAGRIALMSGDAAVAYTALQESARRLTNRVDVLQELAWAAFGMGRLDEAERHMQAALALQPDASSVASGRAFLGMLQIARSTDADAQSPAQVQQVLQQNPRHGAALMAYGVLAERQGRVNEATNAYERLMAQYPTMSTAARNLAVLYAEIPGAEARGYDLAVRAREAFPRDDAVATALGKLAARRGDHRYAVQLLSDASRSRTNDASLFYALGVARQALNQTNEARASLERALALQPDAPFAADARTRLEK